MEITYAVELIKGISYKPGWRFGAALYDRYEGTVSLRVQYPVFNSNREHAPMYTEPIIPIPIMEFWLYVEDCKTDLDLYGKVMECLLLIERHEAREFFAVGAQYDKPFHPHTVDGLSNWAARRRLVEAEDISLGVLTYA